ncbi:MAG: ligase-associated DNA damage response endonuclease PdeM [Fimbriimonadaceae bacterium]|jgi:DNA ligase-associated metallophosphoesterase|nr:ligase-associated DNA damage response endonuclease PdeM [Fimbriimonadaceae bacterium]
MVVDLLGKTMTLLPERAVLWEKVLFVADLHLGKGHEFRKQGLALPAGSTSETLEQLSRLASSLPGLERVVVLGDVWHSRSAFNQTADALVAWAQFGLSCQLVLIKGNHDRWAATPSCVEIWPEGTMFRDWKLFHTPRKGAGLQIAGHLHPVVRLGTRKFRERLPCFHFNGEILTLPSFGAFTGGMTISPQAGDLVWVTTGIQVIEIPTELLA